MRYEQIYDRINSLCEERGWTLYKLAGESNVAYSTLYNMMERHSVPQLDLIQNLCDGFNITLADFFIDENAGRKELSQKDMIFLNSSRGLDSRERNQVLAYIQALQDMKHNI